MPPHVSKAHDTPITHGSPRLIAEQDTGQDAARAYAVRYAPGQHMPMHTHASASISLILAGGFEDSEPASESAASPRLCGPLTVAIKPAGAPHETLVTDRGVISLMIQLPASAAHRFLESASAPASEQLAHESLQRCRWWHANETASPLLSIWLALLNQRIDLDTCLDRLAPLFLAPGSHSPAPPLPGPLRRATALLTDGYSIADTAHAVGLHPSHLTRRFRARLGSSPSAWARKARLATATERLLTARDSLSTCALAAGYADQAHMNRQFRADLGVTPGQLRSLGSLL